MILKGQIMFFRITVTLLRIERRKKLLIIRTIDDNIVEPDEAYILFINTPTSGFSPALPVSRVIVGENGTATITIVNDDGK